MTTEPPFVPRGWLAKFRVAFRGWYIGLRGQPSFLVHFLAAAMVVVCAAILQVSSTQWCLLVLCITGVIAAEYFNTSLEHLAKAVDRQWNPYVADALDTASGAVLLVACGAVIVGAMVFAERLWEVLRSVGG